MNFIQRRNEKIKTETYDGKSQQGKITRNDDRQIDKVLFATQAWKNTLKAPKN